MVVRLNQPAFSAGELAPTMDGRTDQIKYHIGVSKLYNFIPHIHGGASNRGGFGFFDCVVDGWYFPFEFSVTQSYALLLGGVTRFFPRTAFVQTNGAPVVVTTDIRAVAVYEWVVSGSGTDEWYVREPGGGNPFVFCSAPAGVDENSVPMTRVAAGPGSLAAAEWAWGDNDSLGFRTIYVRMAAGGNPNSQAANWLESDLPYMFLHPYEVVDLPEVTHVQANDLLYMAHRLYKPQTLTRNGHTDWVFSDTPFGPGIDTPVSPPGAVWTGTGTPTRATEYAYSALDAAGNESALSPVVSVNVVNPWPADGIVTLTVTAVTDAVRYYLYKNVRGFFGWIGETPAPATPLIDDNIVPDETFTPQTFDVDIFANLGDFPRAVSIYQQRLTYGGTDNNPLRVEASQTGLFNNFGVSSPLRDTDAISVPIASRRADIITHMLPLGDLIIMTTGSEWIMRSSDGSAITPFTAEFKVQGYRGSSTVIPQVVGNTALFTQRHNNVLRDLTFALEEDSFTGNDLTVLANHLFRENTIKQIAYQQTPDSIVWVVRNDGILLSFTYMREQDIWAWAQHETDGAVISITTISGATRDDLYLLIKRNINDQDVYYSEYLRDRLIGDDVKTSFFVDSGLSYSGPPVVTFGDLDHLIGEEVVMLADGSVLRGLTVNANGQITIQTAAAEVAIGLAYQSDITSLPLDGATDQGTIQGKNKKMGNVALRLDRSRVIWAAISDGSPSDYIELKVRTDEDAGEPTRLQSDIRKVNIPPQWKTDLRLYLQQRDPVPVTILSMLPEVIVGDS